MIKPCVFLFIYSFKDINALRAEKINVLGVSIVGDILVPITTGVITSHIIVQLPLCAKQCEVIYQLPMLFSDNSTFTLCAVPLSRDLFYDGLDIQHNAGQHCSQVKLLSGRARMNLAV